METRARYILVGIFSIAVIVGVFAFMYWLENAATLRNRLTYQVRFESPVSGLLVGASVSFNGIRVGEVTDLSLNSARPEELTAAIAVDRGTPIRADTQAEIDYQGVTGIAAILLTGGSPTAPPLSSTEGQPPVIVAKQMSGRSWTLIAAEVLSRIDGILQENSEPLHSALSNLSKFSETLAGNSDRIDGILAGLERMTGGASAKGEPPPVYDIIPPRSFPPLAKEPAWQLSVPEPTVLLSLNTDKLMLQPSPGEIKLLADARWTDNLPILFQEKVIQSFENAGYLRSVVRPADGLDADYRLLIDIRRFAVSMPPGPAANVEFVAKILAKDGKVVAARMFKTAVSATATDASAAVAALTRAFADSAMELIKWTTKAI